ncbi:MFS transporter [Arthrobacter sp. Sa2CUA1]|uniref:MFS transporter n=1 Tax=Arthrobacter gallicola TaxID=2762225 RepID=A0ABR8UTT9_9MICC|nr:MFS transporter [Arthrobacter gallicola]MBD7995938.1 MFS transporter [Arthrobacter gallicola]
MRKNLSPAPWLPAVLLTGILLASLNLRPAISSLGPLLDSVIEDLQLGGLVAGLLTAAPAVCFAVFGSLAPKLAVKRGPEVIVLGAMAAIGLGLLLRAAAPNTSFFLFFSAVALSGIAVGNVLMPVLVKQWFPDRIGRVTGLYTTTLSLGTAVVAAVAVPVNEAFGGNWRFGLGVWAVPALVAFGVWVTVSVGVHRQQRSARPARPPLPAPQERSARPAETTARTAAAVNPWRSPTSWWLAVFFGLQASAAYICMGWLAKIFSDNGLSEATAGLLLAIVMGVSIPLAFVIPNLAARRPNQGPIVIVLGFCGLLGHVGLWFSPASGSFVWAVLLGISSCTFSLALTMIGIKSRSSDGVIKLSAFTQSIGYLISIPGPLIVGILHEVTGGWQASIGFMTAQLLVQIFAGYMAGRSGPIEGPAPEPQAKPVPQRLQGT